MTLQEISEVVYSINDLILGEDYDDTKYYPSYFNLVTDGNTIIIQLFGIACWSSEEDERTFFEDKNEYEDLKEYLKRQWNETIKKFKQI
jgi:hypothetical protein